jgi:hypothetical protein
MDSGWIKGEVSWYVQISRVGAVQADELQDLWYWT